MSFQTTGDRESLLVVDAGGCTAFNSFTAGQRPAIWEQLGAHQGIVCHKQ
jgi:hypothetical protein